MSRGIYKKIYLLGILVAYFFFASQLQSVHALGAYDSGNNTAVQAAQQAANQRIEAARNEPLPDTIKDPKVGGQVWKGTYTKLPNSTNEYVNSDPTKAKSVYVFARDTNNPEKIILKSAKNTETGYETGPIMTDDELAALQDKDTAVIYCGITWNLLCYGASLSYYLVFVTSNQFLIMSGKFFNYVMTETVLKMKSNLNTDVINIGWTTFRDIINILFIFVLIYAAIQTILKGTGETGKTIATVIVVAVLINFSMFFTKVIIDISNTLAVSFYNSIKTKAIEGVKDSNGAQINLDTSKYGIAEAFINQTGVTTIIGMASSSTATAKAATLTYLGIIKQCLIGAVFVIILGVILLLMSLMMLTRFIILTFVLITSSLAFGSYIWPDLESKIAKKWWPALIGQAFFIPVFLLMLYVTLIFSKSFRFDTGAGFAYAIAVTPGQLISYCLIVGMLFLSMKVAKSMADQAGDASGKITGFMGGLAMGGAALVARNSVGRVASYAASKMDPKSSLGLMFKNRLDGLAENNFDLRSAPGMGSLLKTTGVDIGKATKSNFADLQKKKEVAFGKEVKEISNEVDPKDPHGRTYREIYQSSWKRKWSSGARGVQRKVSENKSAVSAASEKSKAIKDEIDRVTSDQDTFMKSQNVGGMSYSQYEGAKSAAEQNIEIHKAAMAQAIAQGNQNKANQIQQEIAKNKKLKADAEAALTQMRRDAEAKYADKLKKLKEDQGRAQKDLEKTTKDGEKIGQEKDADTKDLLKAIKESKSKDD